MKGGRLAAVQQAQRPKRECESAEDPQPQQIVGNELV